MRRGMDTRFIDGQWVIDVSLYMPEEHLKRATAFIIRTQKSRLGDLEPFSDRYASCLASIEAAKAGKVQQRLVTARGDSKGDLVSFDAAIPKEDQKIFSLPRLVTS